MIRRRIAASCASALDEIQEVTRKSVSNFINPGGIRVFLLTDL
jgi:hypothetical protein